MEKNPRMIEFIPKGDEDGYLVVLENNKEVPFDVKRTYFIYGTQGGIVRGHHAHHKLKQLLVCVSGSVDIYCEYKDKKETYKLDSPTKGLFIEGMIWHEMLNFSPDAVLMVWADDYYDESDYVRNYDDFLRLNNDLYPAIKFPV